MTGKGTTKVSMIKHSVLQQLSEIDTSQERNHLIQKLMYTLLKKSKLIYTLFQQQTKPVFEKKP